MSAEFRRSIEPKKPEDDDEDEEDEESSKDKKSKRTLSLLGLLDEKDQEKTESPDEDETDVEHANSLDELIASILSDDEKAEVVKRYTDVRQDELDSQLKAVEHDSPEEVALMADEVSLQRTNELIEQGMPAEAASDAATQEVADVVTSWSDEHETEEPVPEDAPEAAEYSAGEEPVNEESNDIQVEPTVIPSPTASDGGSGGEGNGGGGEEPPVEDQAEDQPLPPRRVTAVAPTFSETIPAAPVASRVEAAAQPDSNRAGDLLLGGIVGYIIGRRGGRKRTERRLMPMQRELEAQVKDLQDKIVANETKITQLTKERASNASPEARHQLAGRIATAAGGEVRPAEPIEREVIRSEKPVTTPERPAEAALQPATPLQAEQASEVPVAKQDVREMLLVADKISIANVRVGELYRTQRIDAVTLRRVVEAYSAGEGFEKILREGLKPVMSQEILSSETSNRHHIASARDGSTPVTTAKPDPTLPPVTTAPTNVFGPSQPQPSAHKNVPVPTSAGGIAGVLAIIAIIVIIFLATR